MKQPNAWPQGVLPLRLRADLAAFCLGVSVTKFYEGVDKKIYPQPIRDGGIRLWLRSDLEAYVDAQRGKRQYAPIE